MIDITQAIEITNKLFARKVVNFILADRFCDKHMRRFLNSKAMKLTLGGNEDKYTIVKLVAICSVCKKAGICYYLDEK